MAVLPPAPPTLPPFHPSNPALESEGSHDVPVSKGNGKRKNIKQEKKHGQKQRQERLRNVVQQRGPRNIVHVSHYPETPNAQHLRRLVPKPIHGRDLKYWVHGPSGLAQGFEPDTSSKYLIFGVSGSKNHTFDAIWDQSP